MCIRQEKVKQDGIQVAYTGLEMAEVFGKAINPFGTLPNPFDSKRCISRTGKRILNGSCVSVIFLD